jgi:hypothetical protein
VPLRAIIPGLAFDLFHGGHDLLPTGCAGGSPQRLLLARISTGLLPKFLRELDCSQ